MNAKLKPWLILAVIFVAGGLSGAALTMALSPHFLHRPPGMALMKKHLLDRYADELHLTPEQTEKVRPILDDAAKDLQSVHHDELQRVSQIFKATDARIAPLLTDQQKAELPKLEAQRENAFQGRMRGHGNPDEPAAGDRREHEGPPSADAPPPPGERPPPPQP